VWYKFNNASELLTVPSLLIVLLITVIKEAESLKRRQISMRLHDAIFQEADIFILAAARTLNLA
jgi:hypothetical protein